MSVHETNQSNVDTEFIWTIENFELCENIFFSSPEFSVVAYPKAFFTLVLSGENDTENSKYFSLFVRTSYHLDSYQDGHVYSFVIGLITRDGKKNCIKFDTTFENDFEIGERKFIEKEKVYSEKQIMLPDGDFTLFCEVSKRKVPLNFDEQIHLKEFSNAFVKLYDSGKYSDVTVEVQEKSFKIHKAIIEARFPGFLKNLNGGVCKIENITAKTVEALLQYLYSGYLKVSDVNVHEVFTSDYKIPTHLQSLLLKKSYLQHQKIKAVTRIGKNDLSFTWKIHNFESLEPGEWQYFCFEKECFMVFVTLSKNKDNLIISIERSPDFYKKLICNIEIAKVNKSYIHFFEEDRWTLPDIPLKDIFNEDIIFSREYDVKLDFKISVADCLETNETTTELLSYEDSPQNNAEDLVSLQNDLQNLYHGGEKRFSDVSLKHKAFEVRAHKCILSARSETFADLLQNDTAEKEVVVIDFEKGIADFLLSYIYSNRIRLPIKDSKFVRNHAIGIYNAANKYKFPELRKKCSELLKETLNANIAGEYLVAAYDCNDTDLKDYIYNFVCSKPQDIAKSKKWNNTMKKRADISAEVLRKTLSHFASKQK